MTGPAQGDITCCPPASGHAPRAKVAIPAGGGRDLIGDVVQIPGGSALIGTAHPMIPDDGESPPRSSTVKPFSMGSTPITTAEFAAFVAATGYVTDAEHFGWSFVFWSQVPEAVGMTQGVVDVEWWRKVHGATWRDVYGPGTGAEPDHPVTHVSWHDAKCYAKWVGGRLPTEAEWEHAARAGQGDVPFPWGTDEPTDQGPFPCNIWQGAFPDTNTAADGYVSTAPARSFEPNAYGLYNMVGNVWEWTAQPFRINSLKKHVRQRLAGMSGFKLLKGGSALCHRSYCYRYRIAARSGNAPDSTTTHQGFRLVWDV